VYGLQAIANANGWAMAALGIAIVFCALALLSLVISQLYKVLEFWENRGNYLSRRQGAADADQMPAVEEKPPKLIGDLTEAVRNYRLLTQRLGSPFSLTRLLELAEKTGQHRPYATLSDLVLSGAIVADSDGYFNWKEK
jgi:hypothetical protein